MDERERRLLEACKGDAAQTTLARRLLERAVSPWPASPLRDYQPSHPDGHPRPPARPAGDRQSAS